MVNFGAELRPIGLVFPSWKLNLASFGLELEIVQPPPRAPGHAARTSSPRHDRGGGAAPGHWGRGFRAAGSAASTARPSAGSAAAGGATTPKAQEKVRVQRTKAGKGGKLVTAITGLEIPEAEARALLKTLKASSGTGGTLKDGVIELQGDQVAPAVAALEKEGFRPKQAGG